MANESIAFDVELKTAKAATGVQSLRTELKNLRNQLASLDEGSAEFSKIAAKAGAVQDKIGDLKDTIAAFHPERKFQAFTQGIQGVVGGFTAVQGAMALFGNESEDLQKTLVKVQGAMALSQGLNSVMGLGDAFKNLQLIAVAAFNSIKVAMLSNPIFAIATVIATVAAALYVMAQRTVEVTVATIRLTESERETIDGMNKSTKSIREKTESLMLEYKAKLLNIGVDELQLEANKEKLNDYIKEKKDLDSLHLLLGGTEKAKERVKNLDIDTRNRIIAETEAREKRLLFLNYEIAALYKNVQEQEKLVGVQKKLKTLQVDEKKVNEKASIKRKEGVELKKEEKEERKLTLKGEKEFNEKIKVVLTQRNEDRKNALEWIAKAEVQIKSQTIDSLAGIGVLAQQLAGESKELMAAGIIAENAAGIAKIIINAQAANAAAIAQGTALAIPSLGASVAAASALVLSNNISAGIAIASSVAATTKALSALGSGGSAEGGGNTSAPPPMTRPQSSRVSLDSGGKPINVSDKSRQKVYVVERDITNTQSRVSVIQNRAKFG